MRSSKRLPRRRWKNKQTNKHDMIDISLSPLLPLPPHTFFSNLSHCQRAKSICAMVSATKINEIMAIITILCEKSQLFSYHHISRQFITALQFISCEPHCNNICTYKVIVTQLNSNSCRYIYFQLLFVPLFPFLVYWTAFKLLTNATSTAALL